MERTELREAFFAEVARDPWLAFFNKLIAEYWTYGYEAAMSELHERGLIPGEVAHGESFSDRAVKAQEWLTEKQRKSEMDAQVAMAALARATEGKVKRFP